MIDLGNLQELTEDDAPLMQTLLDEFLNTTEEDLRSLDQAVKKKMHQEIASLAHRIKGSSMIVGASQLIQLTNELEEAGKRAENDKFESLLSGIKECYSGVSEAIRKL
ncbi:Hpt domain-containing protein [Endozoicomonas sp. 8E]|uniref:Hpt domain-containing protein n=1 Tax=Endozoicomonas sp. 8E TaxID=3035692 RepID=UPI0029390E78|nr:Hpt domain-containing protein [Endozoicomonas sp. 8E]WOG29328.1 Hpt domain-containing protein [Endozoicomonas sp. 8E]